MVKAADTSGETLQEVPYQDLTAYINKQTPTTRTTLAPILQDTLEQLSLNDPNKIGTISIRALEDVYQNIGKKAQPGTPNSTFAKELKDNPKWETFDLFNFGIVKNKPSSTGLTLVKRK